MPEPETGSVIAQLKEAIQRWQAAGRSLNQLADKAEVNSGTVVRFVNNERTLTLPTVEKICRALKLNLTQDGDPFADDASTDESP